MKKFFSIACIPAAVCGIIFFTSMHKTPKQKKPADGIERKYTSKKVKKPVTVNLSGGLQYTITSKGNGPAAEKGCRVQVLYTGKLTNDTVFDASSLHGNQPFTFHLGKGEVIAGWDSVCSHAHAGDKISMHIPPQMGYGQNAMGKIPANSTLIFDIEVLDVLPPTKPWDAKGKDTITTKSGLKVIFFESHPDSLMPKTGHTVTVDYSGFLLDGTLFDSSVDRGQPFQFPIGQGRVIKGWDEGIAMLHKGDKAKLIIPYDLGYGSRGFPGVIPPNSTLVFDVHLIDIK